MRRDFLTDFLKRFQFALQSQTGVLLFFQLVMQLRNHCLACDFARESRDQGQILLDFLINIFLNLSWVNVIVLDFLLIRQNILDHAFEVLVLLLVEHVVRLLVLIDRCGIHLWLNDT